MNANLKHDPVDRESKRRYGAHGVTYKDKRGYMKLG